LKTKRPDGRIRLTPTHKLTTICTTVAAL